MNPPDRPIRNPALALAPHEDGYLAYDTESGKLHRLNAAAALIVELCDGTRDVDEVSTQLAPLIPEANPNACRAWIEAALQDGILKGRSDLAAGKVSAESLHGLAKTLRQEGAVLAAFVCQDQAVALDPTSPHQWAALGELAHIVERRERAREAYERYMAFEPEDAEVEQILVALRDKTPPTRASDKCIQQIYSRFASFYEKNMCGDLDYQAPVRLNEALEAVPELKSNLDVLELGCGTGLAGRYLRSRARLLAGIDLSAEMLEKAQATGLYDTLDVAEITSHLNQETRSYDLIVACDTLIYFGDLRQILIPARRCLRSGGFIAFTVERGNAEPFRLTDSGRYSHSASHVAEVAEEARLTVTSLSEGFLRNEYGKPVTGLIALLQDRRK